MAFVAPTRRGTFEIRESRSTAKGPRSHTLASFSELDEDTIERARRKAAKPVSAEELKAAARRVGAPVEPEPADRAARGLLVELGKGRKPEPRLKRLLSTMLEDSSAAAIVPATPSHGIAQWMTATPRERGKTLVDLLLLADALPHGGLRGKPLRFPRLNSTQT